MSVSFVESWLPVFAIAGTRCFPQTIGKEHFRSDDFKAEASAFPGQELHQTVQALGISGGIAVREVVEYCLSVVLDCHCQWQEAQQRDDYYEYPMGIPRTFPNSRIFAMWMVQKFSCCIP